MFAATGTQLHHQIHWVPILIHAFKLHNVMVPSEMVHDLNLMLHVFDVVLVD